MKTKNTKVHRIFQPFDKVLVKDSNGIWQVDLYSHWCDGSNQHVTLAYGDGLKIDNSDIIQYEGNEYLLGTNDKLEEEIKLEKGEWVIYFDEIQDLHRLDLLLSRFEGVNGSQIEVSVEGLNKWHYGIRLSDFNPYDMKETRKHILCVKNGKVVRYSPE